MKEVEEPFEKSQIGKDQQKIVNCVPRGRLFRDNVIHTITIGIDQSTFDRKLRLISV
jgi:hypothetical protein